jgi:hypothetical protein
MFSPEEVAAISAEIENLKQARLDCCDSGLLKIINACIEQQKRKLEVAPQNNTAPPEQRGRAANAK